jgi:hypothetical protein
MAEGGMGLGILRGRFWGVLIEKFDLYMKREEALWSMETTILEDIK